MPWESIEFHFHIPYLGFDEFSKLIPLYAFLISDGCNLFTWFLLPSPYFFFNAVYSCSTLLLEVIRAWVPAWVGLPFSLTSVRSICQGSIHVPCLCAGGWEHCSSVISSTLDILHCYILSFVFFFSLEVIELIFIPSFFRVLMYVELCN